MCVVLGYILVSWAGNSKRPTLPKQAASNLHYPCYLQDCATGAALPITTDPGGGAGAVIGIAIAVVMIVILALLVGGLLYRRLV